jgi:hypothetical protein
MKFKVGDKVRVIKCSIDGERCKNLNKVSTITEIGEYLCYPYMLKDISEPFKENELALVEKQFTKSDLKDGDIVTKRNGEKRTLVGKYLHNVKRASPLTYYTEDLKDAGGLKEHDIIKVERPVKYETVFERKEEILDEVEKRYLASVIKPFRHNVEYIKKFVYSSGIKQIKINVGGTIVNLPEFKNDMYKGMTPDRKYSLKELGL